MSQFHLLSSFPTTLCFQQSRNKTVSLYTSAKFSRLICCGLLVLLSHGGCEKQESSIIDSIGQPPVLMQVDISPSSINSDSINIGPSRSPDDVLPLTATMTARVNTSQGNPISTVHFSLKNPVNNATISDGDLFDNGLGIDRTKGDGVYSGKASFEIKRVEIGVFRLELFAEAENGFQSNTVLAPLSIYRGNRPPVLLDLDIPDTLQLRSQAQLLTLRVRAADPDGLADIARVIFSSYKPDGIASSGNPFEMYDDGSTNHGDERAGDGLFSLIITLPSTTVTGVYRFEFQAFDRSNEVSSTVIHRVTVKQ